MGKVRNFIFLGLLIALFIEVLIVFPLRTGRREDDASPSSAETAPIVEADSGAEEKKPPAGPSEQKIQGLHLVESQKGSRDWELFAVEAEGGEGLGHWKLQDVRVLFYSNEQIEFTVTGKTGMIDTKTRDMRISGGVTTTSVNGYVFETAEVNYDAGARKIRSPSDVAMRGPRDRDGEGMKFDGHRMEVDVATSKMTILSDVRGGKVLNGGRHVKLVSRSAEFSGKSKGARFIGDVVMEYDRVKLEGPEAAFLQSEKGNFLSQIRFSGGVKVSDADKFATSENLDLDLLKNRFVFTGRPKVYQGDDELSGEQIIFLEGGKKVRVEKAKARVEKVDR